MGNLAIIPARSGSKGLPDKNIKPLIGKPLMVYTIEAALVSGVFEEVMVSTDSEEYKKIAEQYGAKVPFLRSREMASDSANSWDMVKEVLRCYAGLNREFDTFCLLQPTSPLRRAEDIMEAYHLFEEKKAVSVVSLCEMEHSPFWCNTLKKGDSLENFIKKENVKSRQVLDIYYRINGAIYIIDINEFYKDNFLYRKGSYAYIMKKENSIDIDDEFDFKLAGLLLEDR